MIVSTALEVFGRLDFLVNTGGGQFEQAAAENIRLIWR